MMMYTYSHIYICVYLYINSGYLWRCVLASIQVTLANAMFSSSDGSAVGMEDIDLTWCSGFAWHGK